MDKNLVLRVGFGLASFSALMLCAAQAGTHSYPAFVKDKTLYATEDVRGKVAPKLLVSQWLTGSAPVTKGKVVLVDFWATWCPPCRETIPELNVWAKKFKDDLVVIGISNESPDVVAKFMKTTPMNYNVGVDAKDRSAKAIGVQGIPHVLVISPDGVVRWQGFPLDDKDKLTSETLAKIIAASKKA